MANPVEDAAGDSFRKLAFRAGLGMLFVRMAVLSELLFSVLHINTYLLYIVGPPAILGVIFTGGVGRTFRHPAAWFWLGFFCCMMLSLPFSSWVGGSVSDFRLYAEFAFPLLFTVGGLTLTWSEVRSTFYAMGAAGLLVIGAAGLLASGDSGRVEMTSGSGSIGNSNDLASHLILLLPFVLFMAMDRRRASLLRYLMIVPIGYALSVIFGTASRGALIALGVSFAFVLFRASGKQRVVALIAAVTIAISIPFFLHGNAADRLASLFGSKHEEARESEDSRSYLLKQSLIYTLEHPIVGVGMGQFSNYEGGHSVAAGKVGNWHETHNAFTEVSSECGIPALIFFVLGIGSALLSVNRIYRRARREEYTEIANASFCYLVSMVGFMVSITFLANAFRFYLPAMIGLAIALTGAAEREMSAGRLEESARTAGWVGPIPAQARMARP